MWVLDSSSKWIYAYQLSNGTQDQTQHRNLSSATQFSDIWSDGTTLWLAGQTKAAWDLASGDRVEDRDIALPADIGLSQPHNILVRWRHYLGKFPGQRQGLCIRPPGLRSHA